MIIFAARLCCKRDYLRYNQLDYKFINNTH